MVSSPAFNVSMFIWSFPIAATFFTSRSAASTSRDVISGTSFGSVWIMVRCSVLQLGVEFLYSFYDLILIMDFSTLLVYEYDQSVLA